MAVVVVEEEGKDDDEVVNGVEDWTLSSALAFPFFMSPTTGAGSTSKASCRVDEEWDLSSSSRALEAVEEETERVPPGKKGG